MILAKNQLISYSEIEPKRLERILWIDSEMSYAYIINILKDTSLPEKRFVKDILKDLEDNYAVMVGKDPYFNGISDDELSVKSKEVRDRRWALIKDLVTLEPDIYDSRKRGRILKEHYTKTGLGYGQLYLVLKKYWIRGMTKNSLLPDYKNSGGKGKSKTVGSKKLGRPRTKKEVTGEGIPITEDIKHIFKSSAEEFYLNTKGNTLSVAYDLMLKKFFTDVAEVENDNVVYKLRPVEELPTLRQFTYWVNKNYSTSSQLIKRDGLRSFNLKSRAVLGNSTKEAFGPGSLYQIDATIADIYLVSRYNRNHIIGRPVVYFVIDVFSRMITGVYCGLEGPSWAGAMMALSNAASDKVSFCNQYGISISKSDWDTAYLPEAILADRGELEGKNAESLISSLNIRIENTPPYRGDWKGIVEQQFKLMHGNIKPFVPGFVEKDHMTRTGKDYRLDAKLDLYQFTKIIINCILFHNNQHWIKGYDLNEFMIEDEIDCIPSKIWSWGIKNRSGILRVQSEEMVKLSLMPTSSATVTYRGIKFKNLYYSCCKAIEEHWFEKARQHKSWRILVAYDPRNMDFIYIKNTDGSFDECFLLESSEQFKGKSIYEIDYEEQLKETHRLKHSHAETEKKINLYAEIENIVAEASKTTNIKQSKAISKKQRVSNIKINRKVEKELNREDESFNLIESQYGKKADVVDMPKTKVETTEDNSLYSLLKKKQEEGMNRAK